MARPSPTSPETPGGAVRVVEERFVGGSHEFLRNGARLLDARTQFHYLATVVTPAMAHAQVGAGSPTPTRPTTVTVTSSTAPAATGCTSTPTLQPRTSGPSTSTTPRHGRYSRSRLRSGPRWPATPARSALTTTDLYDLYFGPAAPEGKESNWVETIPGKSWFQLFRLYGPLEPWFDQTWRLNEFEPLD